MYQDFTVKKIDLQQLKERLRTFRAWMREHNIDMYIVGHNDPFFCEFVPEDEQNLYWLTGFSGSMGRAVITDNTAILFTDGRYILQAASQINVEDFTIKHYIQDNPDIYLSHHIKSDQKIGYDPYRVSVDQYDRILEQLEKVHNKDAKKIMYPIIENPFKELWKKRATLVYSQIYRHPFEYSGCTTRDKVSQLCGILKKQECDYHIISDPTCVAWLCNIRGHDIPHTPIALLRLIISANGTMTLFCNKNRMTGDLYKELTQDMECLAEERFENYLDNFNKKEVKSKISIDKKTFCIAYYDIISNTQQVIKNIEDPCVQFRSIKNKVEIKGAQLAHYYDAIAMCRFMYWFKNYNMSKPLYEIDIVKKLEKFRRKNNFLKDISFPTISGSAKNGAIIHYRVDSDSNAQISPTMPLLVDSGGQYLCGTTDITRTLIQKEPSDLQLKYVYTYVLKALIAISCAEFTHETKLSELDMIARLPLNTHNMDYDHGTGHGVGSYASVHEPPYAISRRVDLSLKEGVIISLEPGYYKEDHYGIRLENLAIVKEKSQSDKGKKKILYFETLSYVPFEPLLIDNSLLNAKEKSWLKTYHDRCYAEVKNDINAKEKNWLYNEIQ